MSGARLLLDTNIVLYFLAGDATLLPLFEENDLVVSFITELELLGYQEPGDKERTSITQFLRHSTIVDVHTDIKEKAIDIRRSYRLKLPDAIIIATALSLDIPMITSDKEFEQVKEGRVILYESQ